MGTPIPSSAPSDAVLSGNVPGPPINPPGLPRIFDPILTVGVIPFARRILPPPKGKGKKKSKKVSSRKSRSR